jgi:putative endonuclease
MKHQSIGTWGELKAIEHVIKQGYVLRARNWRTREGEIDIIASDGDTIVFIEVKTRTSKEFGLPEESLTDSKQRKLRRTALQYMDEHDLLDSLWRIDVIAIEASSAREILRLDHYLSAIEEEDGWG